MKKMRGKKEIWFWILLIVLIAALVYIGVDKWQDRQVSKLQMTFLEGYQQGITDTITTLYARTNDCQIGEIQIGNETRQLVDTACLTTE